MTGHSGYPNFSGRVIRVIQNSGSRKCYPILTLKNHYPTIRVPAISGSGSGIPDIPEVLPLTTGPSPTHLPPAARAGRRTATSPRAAAAVPPLDRRAGNREERRQSPPPPPPPPASWLASREQGAGRRIGHLHPPCIAEDEARGGGEAEPADEITGGAQVRRSSRSASRGTRRGAGPAELAVREQENAAGARRSQRTRSPVGARGQRSSQSVGKGARRG